MNDLAIQAKLSKELPDLPLTKTQPWFHQKQAFWFLYHKLGLGQPQPNGGALLAMDMGTGKTKVAIDVINNCPQINTVLVTCPLAVVQTWPDEVETHGARPITVVPLSKGTVAKRTAAAQLNWNAAASGQTTVYVINHESVWREPFRSFILKRNWDLLIVDECHRAKSPGGKFSRFLATARPRFACRLGLTGTPMPRDAMDIYAQGRFIDPEKFGTNYTVHANRFGIWREIKSGRKDAKGNPIMVRKLVGIKNEHDLQARLDRMSYRVLADDVLDLPPAQTLRLECDLSPGERRVYNDLKRDLVAEIDDGYVTASNILTKILRLQQIVQGVVQDDDGNVRRVGDSKARLLESMLDSLDTREPVVVVCKFHSDLDQVLEVCDAMKRPCLELSGRVNQLQEFKKGEAPTIAVQIQSGGVGVDLSRAAYTAYFAPTYDGGAYEQSLRRTRRPSEHKHSSFFYYHLVARGTIDVQIYQALKMKKKIADAVLEGIR